MTFSLTLTEPTHARYVYIDPNTNQVYLLMPIVSGEKIGLDNTCQSVQVLQAFFGKMFANDFEQQRAVLDELLAYKNALDFDISFLDDGDIKAKKEERLSQIMQYIKAIEIILKSDAVNSLSLYYPEYPPALQEIMKKKEANLHSMHLRPKQIDEWLRFVNPVFSVRRNNTGELYKALSSSYQGVAQLPNARTRLIESVLATPAGKENNFEGMQEELRLSTAQLGVEVDFTLNAANALVIRENVDDALGYDAINHAPAEECITMLLSLCAPELFNTLPPESPFYTRGNAEELSIITQFFLGVVNIYCYANQISKVNFGEIFDDSKELSTEIAAIVLSIVNDASIEEALLNYIDGHFEVFKLNRHFSAVDRAKIKRQFSELYSQIKKAVEFDEFILLDDSKNGPFLSHQGSICLNFAEFFSNAFPNNELTEYFEKIHVDFNNLDKKSITPTNPSVHAVIELTIDTLLEKIKDKEHLQAVLNRLPEDQKNEILASPQIKYPQVPELLRHVARGEQNDAENLLKTNSDAQFLLQAGKFTDYSGRTFRCTAFEYAYWAKDTHMCRMLMSHMDDETKAEMHRRCKAIEKQGLNYTQDREDKNSAHFDFKPLKDALQDYVDKYDVRNSEERIAAWLLVGKAQCDVPAHVAQEYCHPHRSFDPTPAFNEVSLPRDLTFNTWELDRDEYWFPLSAEPGSRLGFDFALCRWRLRFLVYQQGVAEDLLHVFVDLAAVSRLDEVRSAEVTLLRNDLDVVDRSENYGMSC